MTIKGDIERDVRTRQRGVRLKKGDQFWRGLDLVTVDSVTAKEVVFTVMSTGRKEKVERRDFVSRAVTRVPEPTGQAAPLLDRAWAIVGTKSLPRSYRITLGRKMMKLASEPAEKQKIQSWVYALRMDREPKR